MANQVTNYKCPACTGPLHFVGTSGKLECDYCGSSYDLSEIEKMMAEEEAKAQSAFATAEEKAEKEKAEAAETGADLQDWGVGMKAYSCPSCGAELVCDENTVATQCPYCGNPTVVPGQFSGMLKPEYILPFKLDEKAAREALKMHYKNKPLLPSAFSSENRINEIKGVYVPFWMFDGTAEGSADYEATTVSKFRRGNVEVTETKHYDVRRGGSIRFERVPVDASTKMPDAHMDSIEPYDYSDLKPFSSAYLPGFLADKYDVSAEECAARAEERAEKTALDALRNDVSGYNTVNEMRHHIEIHKDAPKYTMLPVYLLATKWNGTDYLFAMNGQTGKLIGDLPVDQGKYWTYFGGIFAAVTLVLGTILALIL